MNTRVKVTAALGHLRICDLTTGFVGPSATRWLAAFGAQVIKVEDLNGPDSVRYLAPFAKGHPSGEDDVDRSAHFNNLNVGKLGLAVDMGGRRGRQIVAELAAVSHIICVDYPGLGAVGLDLAAINELRSDSQLRSRSDSLSDLSPNSPLGPLPDPVVAVGPERDSRDPMQWLELTTSILQAVHRQLELGTGSTVLGPDRDRDGNRRSAGDDNPDLFTCVDGHVAIDCRDDGDRAALAVAMGLSIEAATEGEVDDRDVATWCKNRSKWAVESDVRSVGVPVAALRDPSERVDGDIATGARQLWPMVDHPRLGGTRVEGLGVELSKTSWSITKPAPLLGQDSYWVLSHLLGRPDAEIERLRHLGVIK